MFKLFLITFISILLSGCASLSKEECIEGDWYDIGLSDGQEGYKASRLSTHRDACRKYHVIPDNDAYMSGRQEGLTYYCTPENGLQAGLKGKTYHGVCPAPTQAAFLKQYNQGKSIYDLEQEIKRHRQRIQTLRNKLQKKDNLKANDINQHENEISRLTVRIEEKLKRLYYMKGQAGLPL